MKIKNVLLAGLFIVMLFITIVSATAIAEPKSMEKPMYEDTVSAIRNFVVGKLKVTREFLSQGPATFEDDVIIEDLGGKGNEAVCTDEDGMLITCGNEGLWELSGTAPRHMYPTIANGDEYGLYITEGGWPSILFTWSVKDEDNTVYESHSTAGTAIRATTKKGTALVANAFGNEGGKAARFEGYVEMTDSLAVEGKVDSQMVNTEEINFHVNGEEGHVHINKDEAQFNFLMGTGNAFVCVDSYGRIFRSKVACDQVNSIE